jgi:hypothetical protein
MNTVIVNLDHLRSEGQGAEGNIVENPEEGSYLPNKYFSKVTSQRSIHILFCVRQLSKPMTKT